MAILRIPHDIHLIASSVAPGRAAILAAAWCAVSSVRFGGYGDSDPAAWEDAGGNRLRHEANAMDIEFIGMIHHRHQSEIHPPAPVVLDRDYISEFARAAEAGGFDRMLVGYFSDAPDGFLVAAYAAARTERLSFLLAHRPGFVAPTVAARKLATISTNCATATRCRRTNATRAPTSILQS
jgi:hypothetical protein